MKICGSNCDKVLRFVGFEFGLNFRLDFTLKRFGLNEIGLGVFEGSFEI